jgi:hypothetical protein
MIINHPQHVTWTYLVFQEDKPQCGDYVDPRGHHWYVRRVYPEPGVVLREPSLPSWYVEMGSDHPAYRLEPGEEIRRFFNPSEIGLRREHLTDMLRRMQLPGFDYVRVSEDGFTLIVIVSTPDLVGIPSEVDGMPVECRLTETVTL